jgi:hypothetical protein
MHSVRIAYGSTFFFSDAVSRFPSADASAGEAPSEPGTFYLFRANGVAIFLGLKGKSDWSL